MAIKRPDWMPSTPVFVISVLLLWAFDYMAWSIYAGDIRVVDKVKDLVPSDNDHPPLHTAPYLACS